jgi:hypothetical protein
MLVLAAFSLLGFFRLARTVANPSVAAASALLTAIYPVFFAQSSLAQVDLPAAGMIFWGLESYVRWRRGATVMWFSLAALAKETAILVPLALFFWESLTHLRTGGSPQPPETSSQGMVSGAALSALRKTFAGLYAGLKGLLHSKTGLLHPRTGSRPKKESRGFPFWLVVPAIPLALWYAYHYARTGFVFGNPEFFRYNVQGTLHLLRIFLAMLLRIWQAVGYMNLYVLTIACILAMWHAPKETDDSTGIKQRIDPATQETFLAIAILYGGAFAVIGGAVLARYMLPVVPLVMLVCVSTVWRRLKPWKWVMGIVALAFVSGLFVNPPYGFSPEDNLAYRDYIRLHQQAESLLQARYPNARVLTAWPASDELTQPYLGYVQKPMQVVRIDDFSMEQVFSGADARSRFDVALVFSTKYQPPPNIFDRWQLWQDWKARYFGFHRDLTPEAAASVLGGNLVYVEYRRGQWVGIIEMQKIEEAGLRTSAIFGRRH